MRPIDADRMKEELLWGNVFLTSKETNTLVDLIDNQPTLTPPNEPLTLEELREMDGEPVWLDVADGVWALVDANDDCVWLDRGGSININKLAGKVYRRPPERQEDT